jgi:hypothetical protein
MYKKAFRSLIASKQKYKLKENIFKMNSKINFKALSLELKNFKRNFNPKNSIRRFMTLKYKNTM